MTYRTAHNHPSHNQPPALSNCSSASWGNNAPTPPCVHVTPWG